MPSIVEINTQRRQAGLPLIRFDLRRYSDQDIADLRTAFRAFYAISDIATGDQRGFWAFARGHGYDQDLCHNNAELFLTWHRAYLYYFERALSAAYCNEIGSEDAVITLPYWDWTVFDPEKDAENGIPKVLDEATCTVTGADGESEEQRNPLSSARSLYRVESLGLEGEKQWTVRYVTQLRAGIPWLGQNVRDNLGKPTYPEFNLAMDGGAHGSIHVWVGGRNRNSDLPNGRGDMGSVVSASYDPIFWLHHCMVDRVWAKWQRQNGNSTVPEEIENATVYGGLTGKQVIDHEGTLKYVYGSAPMAATGNDAEVQTGPEEAPLPPTLLVRIAGLAQGIDEATLHLQGLYPPKDSFEVRVFVGPDPVHAGTPMDGNPGFAGRLFFFGHGECFGAPGHCNPNLAKRDSYDLRPGHPLRKRNYSLDITEAVKANVATAEADRLRLSFVVLDGAGEQVAPEVLDFDSVTVVAD